MKLHCSVSVLVCFILLTTVHQTHATTCSCDLHANGCDWNCCCDPDCTPEDKTMFSSCETLNKAHVKELCVSDNLLFSANGKYQVEGTGGGLLCLYTDNYNARFFYSEVPSATTKAKYEEIAKKYRTSSYAVEDGKESKESQSFKFGDPLFVVFNDTQHRGFLPQPMEYLTNECVDTNPARFLLSEIMQFTECVRPAHDVKKACLTDLSLNSSSYFGIYKVLPYPAYNIKRQGLDDLIQPIPICKDESGNLHDPCPTPMYDNSTSICHNVVLKVEYVIVYEHQINNDTTNTETQSLNQVRITHVNVSLTLTNITGSFYQGSKFEFITKESLTNQTSGPKYRRSGNPGYITGYPVLAADITDDGQIFASSTNATIAMSRITTSSNGKCEGKVDVMFGVDIRVGCFVEINTTMTKEQCVQLQHDIYAQLHVDSLPGYVGIFGNASDNITSDWLKIINEKPTLKPDVRDGQCQNVYTDVTYEVLFADTGFQGNPQRKIVGVEVQYGKAGHHSYVRCTGLFCSRSQQERVELVQVVSFVDVSRKPQVERKSRPQIKAKASHSFFYPFST